MFVVLMKYVVEKQQKQDIMLSQNNPIYICPLWFRFVASNCPQSVFLSEFLPRSSDIDCSEGGNLEGMNGSDSVQTLI